MFKNIYNNKNIDNRGNATTPNAYVLESIIIENFEGATKNIDVQVSSFSVSENLYSNTLLASFSIRDDINLMEYIPMVGQEKIYLKMKRPGLDGTEDEIDLTFYVIEYINFKKEVNQNLQTYTIQAVSEHAFKSQFLKISRSTSGMTTDEIQKIYQRDLGAELTLNGSPVSRFKGIIKTTTPLKAAAWLLQKSYDENLAPFFLYETLKGEKLLSSLTYLTEQKEYNTFKDLRYKKAPQYTEESYNEKATRILEVNSDIRFDKSNLLRSGTIAAKGNYLDIAKKKYTFKEYKYDSDFPIGNTLNGKPILSKSFTIDGESMDSFTDAYQKYLSLNTLAYKAEKNYNEIDKETDCITNALYENLEGMSHTLKLYGDTNLNPGVVIKLEFYKAVPAELDKSDGSVIDKHLSGKYLIISSVHEFSEGNYYTRIKVKRDSYSIDI